MSKKTNVSFVGSVAGWVLGAAVVALAGQDPANETDSFRVDFRYAPPGWQTSICLPDDWQKTLVGKDGSLLYDYPGKHAGFKTRITLGLAGETEWGRQTLLAPRVPIVQTTKRSGTVELLETAFAVAPPLARLQDVLVESIALQRLGEKTDLPGWASPKGSCEAGFRNIAVGWNAPIRYRFRAGRSARYTVVFGLCEGHHEQAGQRILDLQIEGKTHKTVDMTAQPGRNVPALFPFEARDENGDGWIDVAVSAAANSPDKNTILNVLWILEKPAGPDMKQLLAGKSAKPALAHLDCGGRTAPTGPSRNDILIGRFRNTAKKDAIVAPTLTIESTFEVFTEDKPGCVRIGDVTTLTFVPAFDRVDKSAGGLVVRFKPVTIPAGKEHALAVGIARNPGAARAPKSIPEAETLQERAQRYWQHLDLPYDRIEVPDPRIQALIDSAIRNIYQAREIKNRLPAFQVGPTCYRGLWVVDGSFLMEAVAFLGREKEARDGIHYLLSFQRADGAFMLIDGHWKETGIALWAITRHARLTGDRQWLQGVWPNVERGVAYIRTMRKQASSDPKAPNAGLIPAGFSDGGLSGKHPEYTNVYWSLVGMRAAVDAACWLDKTTQADDWRREYDDFYAAFRRAAQRDMRSDDHGNRYLPIRMHNNKNIPPQKAQWAFLHAVFPGKLFSPDDPLVRGNMAMLEAVEAEGLVFGTGWLTEGIWNYFGSFYGHGWLWLGNGQKAARILYAFANHASPLLCWREEHMPQGKGDKICGDMPHNWASAEFLRLVRHMLVLERGDELHLFEGLPAAWAAPGAVTRLNNILTEFGPVSVELRVADDGATADLHLSAPSRRNPVAVLLHLDGWSGRSGTISLPTTTYVNREIQLKR